MRKQILLIDDDLPFCLQLQTELQDTVTSVHCFRTPAEALDSYMRQPYCLVIIDPCIEGEDGQALIRIMAQEKPVPLLVLTPCLCADKCELLLLLGATVCLPKTADLPVCVAQAKALMRLHEGTEQRERGPYTLAFGTELIIDPLLRLVELNGSHLYLTRREFDLLYLLASRPRQVFTREQIYACVWTGELEFSVDDAVRFQIKSLRRKLAALERKYIQTVHGLGYRFAPPE